MSHLLRNLVADRHEIAKSEGPTDAPAAQATLLTSSRRSFLGRGMVAAAVPATLLAASNGADAAGGNALPSYYPGSTKSKFQEIQLDEFEHVNIITNTILSLGGKPRPLPTFKGITNLSSSQFLAMSNAFENTGVHAYLGAIPYIYNPQVVVGAAEIALVEAYHAGFVNTLANVPLIPGSLPLAQPYDEFKVVAAVAPFIVSLNDNGAFPPSYGPTPSAANDIAILNYALLLEMLEAEFYYYNVPALFP